MPKTNQSYRALQRTGRKAGWAFSIPKIHCGDIAKYSGNSRNTQGIVIIHSPGEQTSCYGSSNNLEGFVTSGEHSKNEMYYFRVIRSLAEYYNFGTLFRRHDYDGEIVWPLPFKEVTEGFLQYEVEYGCSQCHYRRCRGIIKDLIQHAI